MVKTIKIGERDVRFDTSLAWMFKYRTQFGHDPIDVIMPAIKAAIPLVEMDFMFSAVCEELGLIVAFALIMASLALFCHLMNLCMSASVGDNSSRLSIGAIACLVIFQNFLTIGGASRFIPSTGVVLPFVSYGGSSFIGCSMLFAAVFAIIRYGRRGIYVAKR